jgi:hypothetical protein
MGNRRLLVGIVATIGIILVLISLSFLRDSREADTKTPPPGQNVVFYEKHEAWGPCPANGTLGCKLDTYVYRSGKVIFKSLKGESATEISTVTQILQLIRDGDLLTKECSFSQMPDRSVTWKIRLDGVEKEFASVQCQDQLKDIDALIPFPSDYLY